VREAEAPPDQPAVAEQLLDLLRQRVGGDVEILGRDAKQQVAHATADEIGLEARVLEPVQHAQRVRRDMLTGDRVLVATDHPRERWLGPDGRMRGVQSEGVPENLSIGCTPL
jgi:hypothetical protein